jgi:hypothetical protein
MVVNSKKIRRLMREHDLQPKRRRRFVAMTPIFHALSMSDCRARRYAMKLTCRIERAA